MNIIYAIGLGFSLGILFKDVLDFYKVRPLNRESVDRLKSDIAWSIGFASLSTLLLYFN